MAASCVARPKPLDACSSVDTLTYPTATLATTARAVETALALRLIRATRFEPTFSEPEL
jgi:hypothetical protein